MIQNDSRGFKMIQNDTATATAYKGRETRETVLGYEGCDALF
jgi:hypothetical protein